MISGERRRICRSLSSSQRIGELLVAPLAEEGDEGGLEVAPAGELGAARGARRRCRRRPPRRRRARAGGRRSARPPRCGGSRRSPWCRRPRGRRTNSQRRSRWRGSRPVLGSSRSRTAGAASRPIAMLIRCWLPPESVPTWSSARSASPVCSSICSTRRVDVGDRPRAGRTGGRFSRDGEPPVERRLLRNPADLAAGTSIEPASGSRIPARIESSVVLPAPFGPITASSSPARRGRSETLAERRSAAEALREAAHLDHRGGGGAAALPGRTLAGARAPGANRLGDAGPLHRRRRRQARARRPRAGRCRRCASATRRTW